MLQIKSSAITKKYGGDIQLSKLLTKPCAAPEVKSCDRMGERRTPSMLIH